MNTTPTLALTLNLTLAHTPPALNEVATLPPAQTLQLGLKQPN